MRAHPTAGSALTRLRGPLFVLTAAATAVFFHLRAPNVPDPDSLYHLAHAGLYRTDGPFRAGFPWLPFSIIDRYGSDIWYGFHVLLIPFTVIQDPVLRIKVPGAVLTFVLLVLFGHVTKRLGLPVPFVWPFVLLFAGPNVLLHLTMTRPHVLTLALCALLFAMLLEGGAVGVGLACGAIAFFHLGLVWMIPAIVVAVLLAGALSGLPLAPSKGLAAAAGTLAGWLLRPNPIGAAEIVYVQIVQLMVEKQSGVPLAFGKELYPITARVIAENLVPFLILWGGAIGLALFALFSGRGGRLEGRTKALLWGSLLLSIGFFGMMLVVARRSFGPWAVFSVLFVATMTRVVLVRSPDPILSDGRRRGVAIAGSALCLAMALLGIWRNGEHLRHAPLPGECREAAAWLERHSRPGDVVYNVHWDAFPRLFFWDRTNRYVSGMDPVFLYAFDPALYWKSHYLQIGRMTRDTCGNPACLPDTREDTFTVMRRDFRARWLFIEKDRSPELHAYVRSDPRFLRRFETASQAIFELGDGEPSGPGPPVPPSGSG